MKDFEDVLNDKFEPTKDLFKGLVEADDVSTALIFASNLMISIINSKETQRLEIDATFSVRKQ